MSAMEGGGGKGAAGDEIADFLLAIAPVAGLGRIAAAPNMAIALGYDVAAALEELDQIVLRGSA